MPTPDLYRIILDEARDEHAEPGLTLADVEAYCVGLGAAWTAASAPWHAGPFCAAAVADWILSSEPEGGMDALLAWYRERKEAAGGP